jgi:two-component system CheB/CheR fusion protein
MRMANALKGISVLIVEDDPDMLDTLFLGIGAVGATVQVAGSAEAALALLHNWRPDVVLSDIQLPGVDGFRLLELVRAQPGLRTIPAAALSGGAASRNTGPGGFETYLAKPVHLRELVIALAALASRERPAVNR